jgi:hypothetical protein
MASLAQAGCMTTLRKALPDLLGSQFGNSAVTSRQPDKGMPKPLQLKLIKIAHLLSKCFY